MRKLRWVGLLALAALLVACNWEATPTRAPATAPAPTPAHSTALPSRSEAPSATPVAARPSPFPGAPSIRDPYWLLHAGHDTMSVKNDAGAVTRSDQGEIYHVIEGGAMDGTILINGTLVATLAVYATIGDDGSGLTPIEQQYGRLIDSKPPKGYREPSGDWTYRTARWGATTVYIKDFGPSLGGANAYWWVNEEHSTWAGLQTNHPEGRVDAVLAALLSPSGD